MCIRDRCYINCQSLVKGSMARIRYVAIPSYSRNSDVSVIRSAAVSYTHLDAQTAGMFKGYTLAYSAAATQMCIRDSPSPTQSPRPYGRGDFLCRQFIVIHHIGALHW